MIATKTTFNQRPNDLEVYRTGEIRTQTNKSYSSDVKAE